MLRTDETGAMAQEDVIRRSSNTGRDHPMSWSSRGRQAGRKGRRGCRANSRRGRKDRNWHLSRDPYVAMCRRAQTFKRKHEIPGVDRPGRVEAGSAGGAKQFEAGDEFFGWRDGAFAKDARAAEGPSGWRSRRPRPWSNRRRSETPSFTALDAVPRSREGRAGQKVVIEWARSGGVATSAVQIAKVRPGADVYRGVQHAERGHGPILDRGGPGHH